MDLRAWLTCADEPDPLVVETSGSTGRPKRVRLPRSAVLASAAATERRLGGTGPWVLRLPPTYVAGLMVRVRSLLATGAEPFDGWPDGEGWFTSLVPTQLHRLVSKKGDDAEVAALRRAHTVLLGGGPLDPGLRRRAEDAGVRVVATYGAAETCGGCVYDGVPLDGVRVAVDGGARIRLGGPTLFAGYEGDPTPSAGVLRDRWFTTADSGRLGDDGRLQVLGRLDDVVVSGGVNVPAPSVAVRLRAHPGVAEAEVLGVPDEEWGHRVVAFVALVDGPVSDGELREWVAAEHPRSWAPRQVVVVPDVPLLDNGKPDRLALQALARAAAAR